MSARVSIVVPSYNRSSLLSDLLDSLIKMDHPKDPETEIIVVDNNSTDDTKIVVEKAIERSPVVIRYVFEGNQGSSNARNRGIREARGEIVAFLDDDEIADKGWLASIWEAFQSRDCSGVGGRQIARWTVSPPEWYTTEGPYKLVGATAGHELGERPAEYSLSTLLPTTGNLAVKKACFEKHGLFRADLGPKGTDYQVGEDKEFCMRLIRAGERLVYWPDAIVYNTVHGDRLTREYCRQYYFRFGRAEAKLFVPRPETVRYWNVPRFLFRMFARAVVRWLGSALTGRSRAALYYRLSMNRIGGEIYEHYLQGRHHA